MLEPDAFMPAKTGKGGSASSVDFTKNGSNRGREAAWCDLVDGVQALYPEPLPPTEAEAAAHNLATFFRFLMDADREQRLKNKQQKIHDKISE